MLWNDSEESTFGRCVCKFLGSNNDDNSSEAIITSNNDTKYDCTCDDASYDNIGVKSLDANNIPCNELSHNENDQEELAMENIIDDNDDILKYDKFYQPKRAHFAIG
ncbi:hypothetical protein ACH3XW_43960 [Acanthocheilonema viteae]